MSRLFVFRSLLVAFVIAVVAYAASYLVTPKYSSEVQFFVPLTISEKQAEQAGVGFGGDSEIDAHIQILRSKRFFKALSREFPEKVFYAHASRTRYGAVSLDVQTHNAELSAQMANAGVAIADSIKQLLLVENRKQSVLFLKNAVAAKDEEVKYHQYKLDSIRQTLSKPSEENALAFRYERLYGEAVNELARYTTQLRRAEIALNEPAPMAYVFNPATPEYTSVYPNRLFIAVAAFVMALVLQFFIYTLIKKE
ncbi:MAG: hypothetical protein LAT54_02445 [Cryomorphaceae bacterium]|nr:hypothetical protein [Cryomorphaceae bacterium]